jgi:N-acetylglucosamine-6-sulfatase
MMRTLRGRRGAAGAVVLIVAIVVAAAIVRAADGGGSASGRRVVIARTTRPNIIVILTDDQRWDTLWSMPNVERLLVRHGVTFTNSFVSDSLCCPSRASILTGNYAHTTGVWDNHPPNGGAPQFREKGDEHSTIATWLHADGYDTGLFGKYLNSYGGGVPPGWDRWVAFDYEPGYRPYKVFTNEPGACKPGLPGCRLRKAVKEYSTIYFGDAVNRFIATAPASKPVFVYYAPYAPHRPSTPQKKYVNMFSHLAPYHPPSYNEANVSDKPPWIRTLPRFDAVESEQIYAERQAEYQTLQTVDKQVGDIVATLKATHRLAHSVILFASDNGVEWGEHRLAIGSKQVPYDEALRVPLVVRDEPATTTPSTNSNLIVNVDWAPTLAAIAGAPHPPVEGRSFLPLLQHRTPSPPWRTQFVIEHMAGNPPSLAPSFCGIRATGWMYTLYNGGFQELYNLKTDPWELTNIASDPADAGVVRQLRAEALRECSPPPPRFHP